MWRVEEFADFHAQSIEAAQKKITAPQQGPAPTPPVPEEKMVLWDFRVHQVLIGKFLGPGPVISAGAPGAELKIGTWKFEVDPEKIFHIPQWPALDIPSGNFLGFSFEVPSDGSMYMLQYGGFDAANNVSMTIFKK